MKLTMLIWLSAGVVTAQVGVKRHVTQGRAQTVVENLYTCPVPVGNHRVSAVGRITATDGTVITGHRMAHGETR